MPPDDPVFSFTRGRPLNPGTISQTFHALVPKLGLTIADGARPPTAHHLRHSFAVHTLIESQRSGADCESQMASQSTYLGHVNPVGTYWYLSAAPELMELAATRLDGRFGGRL